MNSRSYLLKRSRMLVDMAVPQGLMWRLRRLMSTSV